jgi:hypothetical protein
METAIADSIEMAERIIRKIDALYPERPESVPRRLPQD